MLYCNEYLYHTFCNVYPIGRKKQSGENKKPKKEAVKSSESDEDKSDEDDDEAKIAKEGTKAKKYVCCV